MSLTKQQLYKPTKGYVKRQLSEKASKLRENDKKTMLVKGPHTSDLINELMNDTYKLKRHNAVKMSKKNPIRPFEDATSLEFFSLKNDASLFMFGSHAKKRPHNIVIGRCYDAHILDMVEFGVSNFKSMSTFPNHKINVQVKPCLIFSGDGFDHSSDFQRIKNLLTDFYRGHKAEYVSLQGLEHVLSFTLLEDTIHVRSYRTELKKSGERTPRVELVEIGPSFDLTIRRVKFASEDLFKLACTKKRPVSERGRERKLQKKNLSQDKLGNKLGRVHMQRQDMSKLNLRRVKALKTPYEFRDKTDEQPSKKQRTES